MKTLDARLVLVDKLAGGEQSLVARLHVAERQNYKLIRPHLS